MLYVKVLWIKVPQYERHKGLKKTGTEAPRMELIQCGYLQADHLLLFSPPDESWLWWHKNKSKMILFLYDINSLRKRDFKYSSTWMLTNKSTKLGFPVFSVSLQLLVPPTQPKLLRGIWVMEEIHIVKMNHHSEWYAECGGRDKSSSIQCSTGYGGKDAAGRDWGPFSHTSRSASHVCKWHLNPSLHVSLYDGESLKLHVLKKIILFHILVLFLFYTVFVWM